MWDWDTRETAYLYEEDGEVVTYCGDTYATRVAYQHHMRCPHCGTRLAVQHELVPRFFASKEGERDAD
jgi:hypothetical protein